MAQKRSSGRTAVIWGSSPSQSGFGFSALPFCTQHSLLVLLALPPLQPLPSLSFSLGPEVPSPCVLLTLLFEHFPSKELSLANREPSGILQTSSQACPALLEPAALVLPAEERASSHKLEQPYIYVNLLVKVTQDLGEWVNRYRKPIAANKSLFSGYTFPEAL